MVQFYSIDSDDEETNQQHADHPDGMALAVDRDHHSTGICMTPKVPPTFDGQSSWFEFEDLIDDWMGITTLTPERLGPSLKNALVGAAEFYKNMLNNADLRHPENGVRHFKDTLRPYFVKGVNHVFLWRFLQLFRCYRGNQEFVLWIGRFEVTSRRVLTAWMDLFHHDIPEVTTVEFFALLTPAVRQQINDIQDPEEARRQLIEIREQQINVLRNAHRQQFPLTDNLMSLVFLVQADLNENQRERFVTSMSLRQIDMAQYTYLQVKQLFMELFCTTRTGIADPTIRHVKWSTFLVIEEGEYDGETGYWVAEEETGDEGFVSLYIEDEFWVLSAKGGYNKPEFLADVSSREKEKAKEAKGNDLVFGQGLRRKARAISQTIKSQMTKHFTERKERKAARKAERNKKTLLRVLKRERHQRAILAHLLAKRTWPILLPPKSTSMLWKPLPLGKMHGRKIIIGTPITDAGFILSNGITSTSRGTILYMTVGTYGLAYNAMESPQIFQSLA